MTAVGADAPTRASRRAVAALAALLVLVGPACGARWTDDQRDAVLARNSAVAVDGDGTSIDTQTAQGSRTSATTAAGGDVAADGGGGSTAGENQGGGGPAVAAGGAGGGAAGPLPCAAPSDAPGVTDSTIAVGNVMTLTGPVPGLGESAAAATRAYVAYRNSIGGVCGRQIELVAADDGQDNGRFRSIVQDMDSKVIGVTGGIMGGDAGGVEIVEQRKIPFVSVPTAAEFHDVSTVFGVNPPFENPNVPLGKHDYMVDQGVETAALVYPGVDQTRAEVNNKHRPQMEAAGIRIVEVQEFPLATLNFDAVARAVANSEADYMLFVSDASMGASMARSMAKTGYELMFEEYLIAYGSNFVELAGSAADGAVTWIRSLPNEEAGPNEEQRLFLEWMERAAPGIVRDTFAADSWAAAKAFFESLEALDGPISRAALVAQLRSTGTYDADGFIGPVELGANFSNGCFIGMRVEGAAWKRFTPSQGFLC